MTPAKVRKLLDRRIALLCVARNHDLYARQHEEECRNAEREAAAVEVELDRAGVDVPFRGDIDLPEDWMGIAERFIANRERRSTRATR